MALEVRRGTARLSQLSLSLFAQIFDMRWPSYGSSLLLKVFISISDPSQTFVTVDYAGEVSLSSLLSLCSKGNSLASSVAQLCRLFLSDVDFAEELVQSVGFASSCVEFLCEEKKERRACPLILFILLSLLPDVQRTSRTSESKKAAMFTFVY